MSIHIPKNLTISDDELRKAALNMAIKIAEIKKDQDEQSFDKILEHAKRIVEYIKKGE